MISSILVFLLCRGKSSLDMQHIIILNSSVYFLLNFLQMAVAIKKILYAADENEDALAEAQEIMSELMTAEKTGLSDDS